MINKRTIDWRKVRDEIVKKFSSVNTREDFEELMLDVAMKVMFSMMLDEIGNIHKSNQGGHSKELHSMITEVLGSKKQKKN